MNVKTTTERYETNADVNALIFHLLRTAERSLTSKELREIINASLHGRAKPVSLRQIVLACHNWRSFDWIRYEPKTRGWEATPELRRFGPQKLLQIGTMRAKEILSQKAVA